MTRTFTGSQGNRLVADDAGPVEGRLIVFLHGGGQTRHSWRSAIDACARRGYHALAFDARGHGESDWTPGRYRIEDFAGDLRAVLVGLGKSAILVGASMGGLAALQALGDDPALPILALVLVDVVPRPDAAGASEVIAFMTGGATGFESLEAVAEAVASYLPGRSRQASPGGLMKNLRERDGRYFWHWDPTLLDDGGPGLESAELMEQVLGNLRIPILLVRGGNSRVVTHEQLRDFSTIAPRAEIVDVAGAAHMVAGDENDAFIAVVLGFIDRVPEIAP